MSSNLSAFVGSIPEVYDTCLGPLFFHGYARDLADRVDPAAAHVLELACGTGILTRALGARLGSTASLVATDLNDAMLAVAMRHLQHDRRVQFRQADAMALPFDAGQFDAVACQFGVMFFPDKRLAFAEARRVLRPGGTYVFNVWDRLEDNPVAAIAAETVAACCPNEPPRFFEVPFGYRDADVVMNDARAAGFSAVASEHVGLEGTAPSAREAATGLLKGGPVSTELRDRGVDLDGAVDELARRLAARFGAVDLRFPMHALVFVARA